MQAQPFSSRKLVDSLFDFAKGVNAGISKALLPRNQLTSGVNTSVRGHFVGPRPCVRKIALEGYPNGLSAFKSGRYQGGCFYNPDNGTDSLMASVSGALYRLAITGNTATIADVSIPGDPNDPDQTRNWLWQAEKWVIVTDGTTKAPIFYDGTSSRRSNYGTTLNVSTTNSNTFVVPPNGGSSAVDFVSVVNLAVGYVVTVSKYGSFTVQSIVGTTVTLLGVAVSFAGTALAAGHGFSWVRPNGDELPPGRMAAYGMGRNWLSLVDGKQFVAGDLVGGSSGTVANNYRDAVLKVTENVLLAGGGNFSVPGSYGDIRAMCFSETLDSSLGQGALQIFTPKVVFSCNAPVDRTTWQSLATPILTESAKGGGALGQWSTVNSNSDILSRALYGIRSLILARREYNTWGNVPVSREIQPQLDRDSESLLGYTSAVVFDNRHLMTTEGEVVTYRGVIWKRLTAMNNDPYSSLQGKEPAVYDALYWQGLNVFQLMVGEFDSVERCFAFTLNRITNEIELWEILKSADPAIEDNDDTRIVWSIETPTVDFGLRDLKVRERMRLGQAEISVDGLRGKVSFQAYYRPEFWPCWVPWATWEECSNNSASDTSPSFRPNMGLPEPSSLFYDTVTNRPLREGYFFQFKLVVTGHCRITGWKFTGNTVPEPPIAPPVCTAICPA